MKAEGLAILTVIKVGFLVTARGGSGIVVARLSDKRKHHAVSICELYCFNTILCM